MSSRTTYQGGTDRNGPVFRVAVRDLTKPGSPLVALDISCDGSTAVFLTTDMTEITELAFAILRQAAKATP